MKPLLLSYLLFMLFPSSTPLLSGLLKNLLDIPKKLLGNVLGTNPENSYKVDPREHITATWDFESNGKWQYGMWYDNFYWDTNIHEYESWSHKNGKTDVKKGELLNFFKTVLKTANEADLNWLMYWIEKLLSIKINPKEKNTFIISDVPSSLSQVIKYKDIYKDNRDKFEWFLNLLNFSRNRCSTEFQKEIKQLIELAIGKLKFLKGEYFQPNIITLNVHPDQKLTLNVQDIGETLTRIYTTQYDNWKPYVTQWLLNKILPFSLSNQTDSNLDQFPKVIEDIFPHPKQYKNPLIILHLLGQALTDKETMSRDVKLYLKNKISKMQTEMSVPNIFKWILYNGKYVPVGIDDQKIPDIKPLTSDEKSIHVLKWVHTNEWPTPIGFDGKPGFVEVVSNISHWIVVGKYVALDENNKPIPGIKLLSANESHPLIKQWITKNNKLCPQTINNEILPVDIIKKLKFINGLYYPIGDGDKIIPGLDALFAGQKNGYIMWKQTPRGLRPVGYDENEIPVSLSTEKIEQIFIINDRYVPVAENLKPIAISPFEAGETNFLVSKWITHNGQLTPLVNDNELVKITKIDHFLRKNNKYIPCDSNGKIISNFEPLLPGQRNPFVKWKIADNGTEMMGPNDLPVKIENVGERSLEDVEKWVKINGIYYPYNKEGNAFPNFVGLSPGETNEYIVKWVIQNGDIIPVGNAGQYDVEESNEDTTIPNTYTISWKKVGENYIAVDGERKEINISRDDQSILQLQKSMWKWLGKKYKKVNEWISPLLVLIQTIDDETQTLPNEYLLKAPSQITDKKPLPEKIDRNSLLTWLNNVMFALPNYFPEAAPGFGLLKYIENAINKIEKLKRSSSNVQIVKIDTNENNAWDMQK